MSDIYAPCYYLNFKCIADRCRHSCCIDWEICIDEATYEKYREMEDVCGTLKACEEGVCFALREGGRCPHLGDTGLCNIILKHGEGALSEICQNHPRFYNRINPKRTEVGLGIVCEEACRLILTCEEPFALSPIEGLDVGEFDGENAFDPLPQRDRIIEMLQGDGSFDEKREALQTAFGIPAHDPSDRLLDRFLSLEILDADWEKDLSAMRGKPFGASRKQETPFGGYYERLLIYFVYRHVGVASCEADLRARLGFAILSTDVIRSLFEADPIQSAEQLVDWACRYSAEIEYSEDNTAELIFAAECAL